MEMPHIQRPVPRRVFDLDMTPASTDSSLPPSPANEQTPDLLMSTSSRSLNESNQPPSRTRSILNLTSSTLLGIYSNTTDGSAGTELNTPWGTGAQTPARSARPSLDGLDRLQVPSASFPFPDRQPRLRKITRKGFRQYWVPLITQTVMLFGFGMGFGSLLTHIHKTQQISPVPIPPSSYMSSYFNVAWGLLGVLIGNTLPQIDLLFDDEEAISDSPSSHNIPSMEHVRSASRSLSHSGKDRPSLSDSGLGPMWHSAVRSVGAFMGIAFALRRIPWQSTLQVSMTLAVANPLLWYLIDRSKPGAALALIISIGGTLLSLLFNPDFVPVPEIHQESLATERLGVFLWMASILFCSSLCFGAIGRRLQL